MDSILLESGEELLSKGKVLQSVNPPQSFFGYTVFSYMIPPFKPSKMLVLGYGDGTVSELTKMIWGKDISVVGVDLELPETPERCSDGFVMGDALGYVNNCTEMFDFIVVDLYNAKTIPEFVFSKTFVEALNRISRLRVCINLTSDYFNKKGILEEWDKYFKFEIAKPIFDNLVVFFKKREGVIGLELA